MRHFQATFLLLLAAAISVVALSAWCLAPVDVGSGGGGGLGEDAVVDDFDVVGDKVVADDAPTTPPTTLTPLPCWEDVNLSLPRGGEDPLDRKRKKRPETCPVADLAAQCPPHKRDVHYENYTMRTYYGGEEDVFFH